MTEQGGTRFLPDAATLAAQGGHPAMRPKDAATLLLLRRNGSATEVLAGRRSDRHTFMPGLYVFPGGRRDAGDYRIPVSGTLQPEIETRLSYKAAGKMTPARSRALAVAAIRETFEEVGLMIGQRHGQADAPLPFTPDIGSLRFVARAITPPGRSRRYDTRFFAAFTDEIDVDMTHLRAGSELEKLEWIALGGAGSLKMPSITMAILTDIRAMLSLSPHLGADIPIPFYSMRNKKFVREEI
jgi:8-oxo-dGTP pyrophosphatase MutT (NUDIX family)